MREAARQGGVFLAMLYGGLAVGIVYDLTRGVRRLLHAGPVLTGVLDLLFGALSCLPAALLVAAFSREGLRAYMLLGMACGLLLYLAGVSRLLRFLGRMLCGAVRRLARTRAGAWLHRVVQRAAR